MPSVATKGVIRILVMMRPLSRPQKAPTATPIAIAGNTGTPDLTSMPVTVPASANTDPTLRSMPPVMMTIVMPMPSRPMTAVCSSTVMPLPTVRKAALPKAKMTTSMNSVTRAESR
ncbi:hypothetical protein D9M68_936900 [compost metagenome]